MAGPTLGVQILGDAAGLKAALGQATAATEEYAAASRAAFATVSDDALKAQLAQIKLGRATAKYGEGSVGAAAATLAYRRQVDALKASHLAAAQSIGRGLTTYVTAPTALLGFEATKMGVEFQKQMLLIQTQAGASAQEVKNLSSAVLKLAPTVGIGPTALAEGLYHLESLGLRGTEAMKTLRISSFAAGMGVANLEDVTTALGGAVVTGIKGAQNYQQAMNTLIATVGAGNMRFEDLAGSIGNVAPAAAAAGVTLPELGAAMATLTDRGFSAEEAATRLRMSFALIQSPTAKAQKALKDMGVDAESLGALLRQPDGLLKVLETLHAAINTVGPTRGNRDLLAGFGGGRSGLGIQTLVQSLDSPLSSYDQKLKQVAADEKKAAAAHEAYLNSPSFKLHQQLAEAEADLTKFGQSLIPIALGISKLGDAFANTFGHLPTIAKEGIGVVIGLLAVGGPLLIAGTRVVKAIKEIGTAFKLLPITAAPAVATTEAELAGVGDAAATSAVEVDGLRASLLSLETLGPLAVGASLGLGINALIKDYKNTKDLGATNGQGGTAGHILQKGGKFYLASPQNAARGGPGGMRQISQQQAEKLLGGKISSDTYKAPVRGVDTPTRFAPRSTSHKTATESFKPSLSAPEPETPSANAKLPAKTKSAKAATAKVPPAFTLPEGLQAEIAKADALAALSTTGGATAQQLKLARVAKADALKAINSHKLTMQQLIEAWNIVGTANTTLAQQVGTSSQKVKTSAAKLISDVAGLTASQKIALEQKFAQVQAHNGYVTSGMAANGVTIHGDLVLNGVQNVGQLKQELQREQKRSPRQRKGRHGGNALAF